MIEFGMKHQCVCWRNAASSGKDYSDTTIIGTDIKCSQDLRAYFKVRLGKGFHFLVPFQQWLHDNPDKTLEDACAAYKEISRIARQERLPIWSQFKYNQFIREQFYEDPEMTFEKAVSNPSFAQTDEQIKFFETAYNPRFSLLRSSSCFF